MSNSSGHPASARVVRFAAQTWPDVHFVSASHDQCEIMFPLSTQTKPEPLHFRSTLVLQQYVVAGHTSVPFGLSGQCGPSGNVGIDVGHFGAPSSASAASAASPASLASLAPAPSFAPSGPPPLSAPTP